MEFMAVVLLAPPAAVVLIILPLAQVGAAMGSGAAVAAVATVATVVVVAAAASGAVEQVLHLGDTVAEGVPGPLVMLMIQDHWRGQAVLVAVALAARPVDEIPVAVRIWAVTGAVVVLVGPVVVDLRGLLEFNTRYGSNYGV